MLVGRTNWEELKEKTVYFHYCFCLKDHASVTICHCPLSTSAMLAAKCSLSEVCTWSNFKERL